MTTKPTRRLVYRNTMKRLKLIGIGTLISACLAGGAVSYFHGEKQLQQAREIQAQNELKESDYIQTLQEKDNEIERLNDDKESLELDKEKLVKEVSKLRQEVSRGDARAIRMEVTAYDLSEASCNKGMSHPAYGLTATGRSLKGHSLESARAIAVDPSVIPLGSKVRIKFEDAEYRYLNGVYTAVDTGGAIKGNHIDLFVGDFNSSRPSSVALKFGRRMAKVTLL